MQIWLDVFDPPLKFHRCNLSCYTCVKWYFGSMQIWLDIFDPPPHQNFTGCISSHYTTAVQPISIQLLQTQKKTTCYRSTAQCWKAFLVRSEDDYFFTQQECISVGCVPPTRWLYPIVSGLWGGGLTNTPGCRFPPPTGCRPPVVKTCQMQRHNISHRYKTKFKCELILSKMNLCRTYFTTVHGLDHSVDKIGNVI